MHHANSLDPSKTSNNETKRHPKLTRRPRSSKPKKPETRAEYIHVRIPPGRHAALFPNLMTARSGSPGDFFFYHLLAHIALDPHLALAPPTQAPEKHTRTGFRREKMPDSFLCSIASHTASIGADGSHFTGPILRTWCPSRIPLCQVGKQLSISSSCQAHERTQFPRVPGSPPESPHLSRLLPGPRTPSRTRSLVKVGSAAAALDLHQPPWAIANMQP